jgi:hypothetical protein
VLAGDVYVGAGVDTGCTGCGLLCCLAAHAAVQARAALCSNLDSAAPGGNCEARSAACVAHHTAAEVACLLSSL